MLSGFEGRVVVLSCRVAQKKMYIATTLDMPLNSTPRFGFLASTLVFQKRKIPN